MAVLSHSNPICSGLIQAKLPSPNPKYSCHKFTDFNHVKVASTRKSLWGNMRKYNEFAIGSNYGNGLGRVYYQSSSNNDLPHEPFPLPLIRQAQWAVTSLFLFLVEQPSQLKYIEWPGFSNMLKTATLTLVLVALLIVALSSVDSALSFLLALIIRRPA